MYIAKLGLESNSLDELTINERSEYESEWAFWSSSVSIKLDLAQQEHDYGHQESCPF